MFKKTTVCLAMSIALIGAWGLAQAQEAKVVVAVGFSGYDELKRDIGFIGQLGGNAQMADALEGMLALVTGGQGLDGIDKAKPWGLLVQSKGDQWPIVGFIPVTDAKKVLGLLKNAGVEVEEKGADSYEISGDGPPMLVKVKQGWAFIGLAEQGLSDLPDDPAALVSDLTKRFNVGVRASAKNVPEQYKQMFLSQMEMLMQLTGQQQPDETDEQYALRMGMMRASIKQYTTMLKELEEVVLGLNIDEKAKAAHLDFDVTFVEGGKFAKQLAAWKEAPTKFAGFDVPGAAMVMQMNSPGGDDEDLEQAKLALEQARKQAYSGLEEAGLDEADLKEAKAIVDDMFEVLIKTLESKEMDGGAVLLADGKALALAAGGKVVGVEKLENALKRLVKLVGKEEPELAQMVKFDAGTIGNLRVHKASIPVPNDDPEAEMILKMVGNPLEVVVAAGNDTLYLAIGKDAESLIKQVAEKSGQATGPAGPPFRMKIALTPLMKFVAAVAQDEPQVQQITQMVATMLEQTPGKDHVTITAGVIPRGVRYRVELEEGILKLIPMAGGAAMGQMGPGANF